MVAKKPRVEDRRDLYAGYGATDMSIQQTTLFVHPRQVAEDFYAEVWGCQPSDAEAAVAEISRQVSGRYDITGTNLTKVLSAIATRHAKAAMRVYATTENVA